MSPIFIDIINSIQFAEDNLFSLSLSPCIENGYPVSFINNNSSITFKMQDLRTREIEGLECVISKYPVKEVLDYMKSNNIDLYHPDTLFLEKELYVDSAFSKEEELSVIVFPWEESSYIESYIFRNKTNKNNISLLRQLLEKTFNKMCQNGLYISNLGNQKLKVTDSKSLRCDIINIYKVKENDTIDYRSYYVLLLKLRGIECNYVNELDLTNIFGLKQEELSFLKTCQDSIISNYLKLYNDNKDLKECSIESTQNLNSSESQLALARQYYDDRMYEKAYYWYQTAWEAGNPNGLNGIAYMYLTGKGVSLDKEKALSLFHKAADAGSDYACINLAHFYDKGKHVKADSDKARYYYRICAEKGFAEAQYYVGNLYMTNVMRFNSFENISKRNTVKAFSYFEKAALQEYPSAMYMMGLFYQQGIDPCVTNLNKAFCWYTKAEEKGDALASFSLGQLYEDGFENSGQPDFCKAFNYYIKAAERGVPEAQYRVGISLYYGKGISMDKNKGVEWIKKAAEALRYEYPNKAQEFLRNLENSEEDDVENCEISQQDEENAFVDQYGVLYSKDGKKLLKYITDEGPTFIGIGTVRNQSLLNYTVREGVKYICEEAFAGCESIEQIILPNTVEEIGFGAFQDCVNLKSITLPEGLYSLHDLAFYGCYSLKNITLPATLKTFCASAFTGVQNITSHSPQFLVKDGCLFSSDYKKLLYFFQDGRKVFSVSEGVECIGCDAFAGSDVRFVSLPSTLKIIEPSAFHECKSLEQIKLPESLEEIGSAAFYDCSKLSSINIPSNITTLQSQVFSGCRSLTDISLSDNIKEIQIRALAFTSLRSFNMPQSLEKLSSDVFACVDTLQSITPCENFIVKDHAILSKDKKIFVDYLGRESKYIFPQEVEVIQKLAFSTSYSLKEVYFNENIKEVGGNIFEECKPVLYVPNEKIKKLLCDSIKDDYNLLKIIVLEDEEKTRLV